MLQGHDKPRVAATAAFVVANLRAAVWWRITGRDRREGVGRQPVSSCVNLRFCIQ